MFAACLRGVLLLDAVHGVCVPKSRPSCFLAAQQGFDALQNEIKEYVLANRPASPTPAPTGEIKPFIIAPTRARM